MTDATQNPYAGRTTADLVKLAADLDGVVAFYETATCSETGLSHTDIVGTWKTALISLGRVVDELESRGVVVD